MATINNRFMDNQQYGSYQFINNICHDDDLLDTMPYLTKAQIISTNLKNSSVAVTTSATDQLEITNGTFSTATEDLITALQEMNIESPFLRKIRSHQSFEQKHKSLCCTSNVDMGRKLLLGKNDTNCNEFIFRQKPNSNADSEKSSTDSGLVASPPTTRFMQNSMNVGKHLVTVKRNNQGNNELSLYSQRRRDFATFGMRYPVVEHSPKLTSGLTKNDATEKKRFKTELCRKYMNNIDGFCEYGERCQYAHGPHELRLPSKHKKYKTELCATFHAHGLCAYGRRCDFIHNEDGQRLTEVRSQIEMFYRFHMLFPHLADMSITGMDEMMQRIYRGCSTNGN